MLHHYSWAYMKFSNYIGCEDIVKKALEIIFSQENGSPSANTFSGIKLCVVGKSGTII